MFTALNDQEFAESPLLEVLTMKRELLLMTVVTLAVAGCATQHETTRAFGAKELRREGRVEVLICTGN
jgi:hypothetical protein